MAGGSGFGMANPRNFKFTSLQAMLNSFISILPSQSRSAKPQISPSTCGGSCDCRKNPRACWPVTTSLTGFNDLNCSTYLARSLGDMTNGSTAALILSRNCENCNVYQNRDSLLSSANWLKCSETMRFFVHSQLVRTTKIPKRNKKLARHDEKL